MLKTLLFPVALLRVAAFYLFQPLIAIYWNIEVKKIHPVPGDIVVLRVPEHMSTPQLQALGIQLLRDLPKDVTLKVVHNTSDICMGGQ